MSATATPIAIVGIATELPSGEHSSTNLSHENFHQFLLDGKDSYETIPSERMNVDAWTNGRGQGKSVTSKGSFLKDIGMFDATEFGMAPKDARAVAVAARKLVEVSFLALLDSGIEYRGRNVGCYASATADDIEDSCDVPEMENVGSLAGIPCMVANKISYHLDLRGPSIPVDTACSSTAIAVHLAVQSLRAGECESAVVAGCQLNLPAHDWASYSNAGILAPDGICKPFDAGGNGFARAEGLAAVILKPLEQAVADGDFIYGTILGTGVSSCGSLAPVNAPVAEAQADAMERAYVNTGKHPHDVDYVECHATGTAAGDPTESNWVGDRFGRRADELIVGSVKGNVGHMEITSFLASLSKVCSMFKTKELAPQAHLKTLNPSIHWDEYNMRVARTVEHLEPKHPSGKFLVSICSSGIGGVNGHAVVESYVAPAVGSDATAPDAPVLLIAGGLSPRSATALGEDIVKFLKAGTEKDDDVSIALGRRSRSLTWRSFAVKQPNEPTPNFSAPVLRPRKAPPAVFLFSGQGPQHLNMGRQLFATYPVFRDSILDLDAVFKARTGESFIHDLGIFGAAAATRVLPDTWPIAVTLPALTAIQLALFDLLTHFGLRPDVLIGHSAGETALLYASGAGSKEMALEIAIARGKAMTVVEEKAGGTMAALSCSAEDAVKLLAQAQEKLPERVVEIACFNAPNAVALAGHVDLIDEVVAISRTEGIMARKIVTRVPVHGKLMEYCAEEFQQLVGEVFERYPGDHTPKVTTWSTSSGKKLEKFSADYFWYNSRNPVVFTDAMDNLLAEYPSPLVVEMAPHPVLSAYVAEFGVPQSSITCPLRRSKTYIPRQEQGTLLTALGQATVAGFNKIDFSILNGRQTSSISPRPALPEYPFARKKIEYFPELSRLVFRQMNAKNGPLNFPDLHVNTATHPELAGHLINQEPIMPAAGFIEMGLEFGARTLWNVKFHGMLSLSAPLPTRIEVAAEGSYFTVKSHQATAKHYNHDPNGLRLHADGHFSANPPLPAADVDIEAIKSKCALVDTENFYKDLTYFAQYGPTFRRLDQLYVGGREAIARIKGAGPDLEKDGTYILHPALLDACFHGCIHPGVTKSSDPNVYFLPSRINAINVYDAMTPEALRDEHFYAHISFQEWHPSELVYDITLLSSTGKHLFKLQGFSVARHLQVPLEMAKRYELVSRPLALPVYKPDVSEDVVTRAKDILRSIITATKKPDIRILEIQAPEVPLLGRQLEDELEKYEGVIPNFTIVTEDIQSIPTNSAPKKFAAIQADMTSENDTLKGVDPQTLDLIVGPGDWGCDQVFLSRLRAFLVPGGSLVSSASGTTGWETELDGAGFTNVYISSNADGEALIYAQAPRLPTSLPAHEGPSSAQTILNYVVGNEIALQAPLKALGDEYDQPIWIVAGEGIDADGLPGFGRTLQREFPQWNIRLATFASCYSEADRKFIIEQYLPQTGANREFEVGANLDIKVPRVVLGAAPTEKAKPAISAPVLVLEEDEVVVESTYIASAESGVWAVVGKVVRSGAVEDSMVGSTVAALVSEPPVGPVRIQKTDVATVPASVDGKALTSSAAALTFAVLVLGTSIMSRPSRFKGRVVVTHADTPHGTSIVALAKALKLRLATVGSNYTAEELNSLKLVESDVVLTASDDKEPLLNTYAPKQAVLSSWTSSHVLESAIRRHPGAVVDALQAIVDLQDVASLLAVSPAFKEVSLPSTAQLFSGDKSYIIVGGMGSLGPHIALWMYQNGARNVVLTSRSGRKTLEKMKDSLPEHVFNYLEARDDFNLGVEPVDGSDAAAMTKLVESQKYPLGGAFLLAATWDDRMFFSQEQSSFDRSFTAKVGSYDALAAAVNIDSLDFLISMSSGTIFGNPGQVNYTSANTALDGKIKKHRNAFSVAAPLIFDTMITAVANAGSTVFDWACSPKEICNYLEDGLRKLVDGEHSVYIPPVDFEVVQGNLGPSVLYDYMVRTSQSADAGGDGQNLREALQALILQFVDVSLDDFSPEVPLTAYGLDSISAGRLSFGLRPFIVVSQMQLLADLSLLDIEARIEKANAAKSAEEAKA